jgi:Tol biopolymer transport system component
VAGDTNGQSDVFVRDRTTQTTVRASVGSGGTEGNGASLSHFTSPISADGRYLVFYSAATNLVAGDTNGSDDVFVRDLIAGTTELVSVTTAGVAVTGHSRVASISDDGSIVAFVTAANLSGSDPTMNDVYLRDRGAGTTTRLSYGAGFTQPNGNIFNPSMSGDGRFVTVRTSASNIVAGDTNGVDDIVVWSVDTGIPVLATVDAGGGPSNGSAAAPKLSPTGRYACFQSSASNLVPGDTNGSWDVFRRDLTTNTTIRVSLGGGLTQITGTSSLCTVTDNGSVGFTTLSSQVIEGDANGVEDVAVYLVL